MGQDAPTVCSLSGQQGADWGAIGQQMITKLSVDSCAAAKLTEKHQSVYVCETNVDQKKKILRSTQTMKNKDKNQSNA